MVLGVFISTDFMPFIKGCVAGINCKISCLDSFGLSVLLIDVHRRSQKLCHIDSGMGLKLGGHVFSRTQNSCFHIHCIKGGTAPPTKN